MYCMDDQIGGDAISSEDHQVIFNFCDDLI